MKLKLTTRILLNISFAVVLIGLMGIRAAQADIIINILAVNGTDTTKEKEINQLLPPEIQREDIIDTAGLDISYDVDTGSYKVNGLVELAPKESRTIRLRVRDVWMIDQAKVDEIKEQIQMNSESVQDTEFADTAQIKRESLLGRLDFIIEEQEKSAGNTGQRIDRYRTYSRELDSIRSNAVSIKYWRSKPPEADEANIFRLILLAENPSPERAVTKEQVHYLPKEVKPEHISDAAGFDIKYDALKGQSFLWKEEELEPGEVKRYEIGIIDIWKINPQDIENLRERTRYSYKMLENTDYKDRAGFLVSNIKEKLERIDDSQETEKGISQHISEFRYNTQRFGLAKQDVVALEELLEVVREDLVRPKLENVLDKIRSFRSISDVAKALFDNKLDNNSSSKAIFGFIGLVALITIVSFIIWLRRSKEVAIEDSDENIARKEEAGAK